MYLRVFWYPLDLGRQGLEAEIFDIPGDCPLEDLDPRVHALKPNLHLGSNRIKDLSGSKADGQSFCSFSNVAKQTRISKHSLSKTSPAQVVIWFKLLSCVVMLGFSEPDQKIVLYFWLQKQRNAKGIL